MTRRIVTAREQRELLSPWMIEAVEDDDRKRKPVVGEDDSKTTTETSEKNWSGDDENKPHAPGAVISQNPYAPDPYSSGSGAYYPAQFSSGGGGSGGGSSQSYGPHSTTSPSGGPPSASLTQALQKAGVDPAMFPLIQGFSAAEGNNPSGAPTLGFTDSQAGSTLDDHAQALAQQIQDRQSVAGEFPASGSPQDQASWMADVVGQNGVQSDWQGNAQPARSDYVNSIVQNMPAPSTPVTSGPTASSPTVSPQKSGRRILTAREQREMLSPWIIEADTSDDEEKKKNAPTQNNWGGDGTKPPMYHIPGAEPIHNKYNTGSGEYYPAQFSSGGTGTNGDGGGSGGSGGGHGGKNQKPTSSLPPIDPSSYGDLNDAAKAFGERTNGMPYAYGHYGENGNSYDCSGLMANYYSLYTGKPMGERPDSFNTASDFESFGFKPGYLPGAFNIGTNGGEGTGGHMAGTLPDGTNVESSGSGGVQYGGNALGAQDFDNVYHLPPPPSAAPSTPAATTPATTPATPTPAPTAGGGAGMPVTGRRQGRSFLSAREQWEMLSPWLIEAESQVAKDIDTEGFISNLMDHFYSATPEQFQKGLWWYRNAHNSIQDASDNTIQDFPKAVAIGAGMSPHNEWGSNLNSLQHFLYNYDPAQKHEWQQPVIHPKAHDEWMRTNRPAVWASRHYSGLTPISDDEYYSPENLPQNDQELESYADAHHGVWGNLEQGSETRQDWIGGLKHWTPLRQMKQMREYLKSYGKKQDRARNPQTDKARAKRQKDVERYLLDQARPEGEEFPNGVSIPKKQRQKGTEIPLPEYDPREAIVQAGLPMIGENIDTAKQIWMAPTGSDYTQFLKGPKTHSFYHNVGDDSEIDDEGYYRMPINPETGEEDWTLHSDVDSTVDTIFSKAATTPTSGRVQTEYTAPPSLSAKEIRYNPETGEPELTDVGYQIFDKISYETTKRINEKRRAEGQKPLLPKQVQAIIWVKFKADLDAAKVRNRGEKWEQNHPGETYVPPDPNKPKKQPKTELKWKTPLYEWWEHENGGMKRQYPRPDTRRPAPDIEHRPNRNRPLRIPAALREAYRAIEAAQHLAMEWTHTYVPQDWEELDGGGYSHPTGFEIRPADEGGFQLWAPTVRGNRLVPIKQPTNDVQGLMDWAMYTQGGPKPAGQRHHLFANTALLDDPVWVQSVADAIRGGGFTFHDRPGDGPHSGYMVSTHPDREEIIPLDEMSPEDVAKFKENNVDLFQGHPENYLGGWANQENQKFYLDVPQHDPRAWGAVDTALDNDELAIYDLGHGWELPTADDGQYNPLLDSHFAKRVRVRDEYL